jgi:type II secretory pathway pseudopilin PulG
MTSHPLLFRFRQRSRSIKAFSLIEALVALSITAMAGAVLLLATEGVLETTNDAVAQTIAQGMATQLIDEVLGTMHSEPGVGPYQTSLGPNNYELAGDGRERFNDTDDFNGYLTQPPEDCWGKPLGRGNDSGGTRHPAFYAPGHDFDAWRQRIAVYYVNPADPTQRLASNQTSDYRAVEVTIERVEPNGSIRPLAIQRRVFCYVPIP